MSHSYRKNPIQPWMRDLSDKQNKRIANRTLRKAARKRIRRYISTDALEALVLPLLREVSDVKGFHPRDCSKTETDPIEAIKGRRK
jgi:hypothetical protein